MQKIFNVRVSNPGERDNPAVTQLSLPTMPYQLLDTLEQIQANANMKVQAKILCCHSSEALNFMSKASGGLYEVNALAQKLAELDACQKEAFDGLLKMEALKSDFPIPVSRMIDFAYSTECCHVVDGITTDQALGKFYVDNDLWGNSETLSEEIYTKLDYTAIGREARLTVGGVFTANSYIEQHSEVSEASKTLDFTPQTPDYTMLLEVSGDKLLKLPTTELSIAPDAKFQCLDCQVSMLCELINSTDNINAVNHLAESLSELPKKRLNEYNAILTAMKPSGFESAAQFINALEEYFVTPNYHTPVDVARDELELIMPPQSIGTILPYLDLDGYGQKLIEQVYGVLTPYGMVDRRDRLPVQPPEAHLKPSGTELMR